MHVKSSYLTVLMVLLVCLLPSFFSASIQVEFEDALGVVGDDQQISVANVATINGVVFSTPDQIFNAGHEQQHTRTHNTRRLAYSGLYGELHAIEDEEALG